MATSPPPSRGPMSGRNCYVTLAFLEVPDKGDKIRSGCLTPAFSGAYKWLNCYVTGAFPGFPNKGDRIKSDYLTSSTCWGITSEQNCYITPAFLGVPKKKRTKSELATSPLPSWGGGGFVTLAFSGDPNKGGKIRIGSLTPPALLDGQKLAELLPNPCILECSQTRGQNQKWLPHPCHLRRGGRGTSGQNFYVTLAFSGVPKQRKKIWKWLPHPCLLGGAATGRNCYATLGASGVPKQGDKIKWAGEEGTRSKVATSSLPSWGSA